MSDFAVKITVRNNRILKAIRALGYESVAKFCQENGIKYQNTIDALGFKCRVTAFGEWNEFAYNLSSALHCEPEELWPEHMKHLKTKKNAVEFSTDEAGVRALAAPTEKSINAADVHKLLASIPSREGHAVALAFGIIDGKKHTGDEIGAVLGVCGARASQLVNKGLRLMKHPSRLKGLDLDIDDPPSLNA